MLRELVLRDIKVKYRRSILGIFWSLLNPLMMMIVMTIVFSNLFKIQIENFMVYFLTGQILFSFFSEATTIAMGSIVTNANLIKKVYIPKYIFPISKVLSSFVNLLFSLIAVFMIMLITKASFSATIFLIPVAFLYLLIFTVGVGLMLSVLTVFFRDMNHIYGIVILAWMYLTPIIYPIEIIPIKYLLFIKLNPMYYFIAFFREIILHGNIPSMELNLICILISLISLVLGLYAFYKNQNKFMLYI